MKRRILESGATVMMDTITGTLMAVLILLLASPQQPGPLPSPTAPELDSLVAKCERLKDSLDILSGQYADTDAGGLRQGQAGAFDPVENTWSTGREDYRNPVNIVLKWEDPAVFAYLEVWKGNKPIVTLPRVSSGWTGWQARNMNGPKGTPEHLVFNKKFKEGEYLVLLNVTKSSKEKPCLLSGYATVFFQEKPVYMPLPEVRLAPGQKMKRHILGALNITTNQAVFKPAK